ncbi:hypothetical protein CKO08_08770 [Halorhodospira halochloris]|nr:hypothetical protein [Halorhodospira halochloris]
MSWPDIVIIAIVALSAGFGLIRGFVREVAALLVWVLAFIVSVQQAGVVSTYLEGITESPTIQLALAFILLFVGIVVVGSLATRFLVKLVSVSGLGGTDRMLGILFGAVRGTVIVALAVLLAGLTPIAEEQAWEESTALNSVKPLICRAGADGWLADISARVGLGENGGAAPFDAEMPAYWTEYCAKANPDALPEGVVDDLLDGVSGEDLPDAVREHIPDRDD